MKNYRIEEDEIILEKIPHNFKLPKGFTKVRLSHIPNKNEPLYGLPEGVTHLNLTVHYNYPIDNLPSLIKELTVEK